jgi:hypothetical protein
MKRVYLAAVFVSICASLNAQSFYAVRREKSLILIAGTGSSSYFGELKNKNAIDPKLNINVGLQYYLTSRISVRSEVTWFTLSGDDAKADDRSRVRRNLSFHSSNMEANFTGAINLFANGNRYYRRPPYNLYAFGGLGLIYFNPKADYQGKSYALEPLHTEGKSYSRVGIVIPFGVGARVKISPTVNIVIEGGYRKTFTDYLDDVSTVYPDPSKLSSPIAVALSNRYLPTDPTGGAPGTQRGNPSNKDSYFLLNFKIEYYLPGDFQLFGSGPKKFGSYNKQRKSSFSRYKKNGKLKK